MTSSPIRTGTKTIGDAGSSDFLKITAGESIDVVPIQGMEDLTSIDSCGAQGEDGSFVSWMSIAMTEEDCPADQLGIKSRFRGFLPVMAKVDGEQVQRIWAFTITVARQLTAIDDAVEGFKGKILRIKRTGKGGLDTAYTIVMTGKEVAVDGITPIDIVSQLGPQNRMGILKLLWERGVAKVMTIMTDEERETIAEGATVSKSAEADEDWDEL